MKVATQMLNTVYTLDDGTGRMDGRKWTDQRNSGPSPDDWAEIQYAFATISDFIVCM